MRNGIYKIKLIEKYYNIFFIYMLKSQIILKLR